MYSVDSWSDILFVQMKEVDLQNSVTFSYRQNVWVPTWFGGGSPKLLTPATIRAVIDGLNAWEPSSLASTSVLIGIPLDGCRLI